MTYSQHSSVNDLADLCRNLANSTSFMGTGDKSECIAFATNYKTDTTDTAKYEDNEAYSLHRGNETLVQV